MTTDPTTLTKLDTLLAALRGCADPRRAGSEWKQVYKLLQETDLPAVRASHVAAMRDVAQLAAAIDQLRSPVAPPEPPPVDVPDTETCRKAMRAFRKRLEVTRLDDESQISSHEKLSRGGESRITAINPPIEWPKSVWQELVRQGKLRYAGSGCYELAEE
jgi:hypothetical protein